MNSRNRGWTGFLRDEGANFLEWIEGKVILTRKFNGQATALRTLLFLWQVRTAQDAAEVWNAVPAVLNCLNDQATYKKPGASSAYAWLYFLERYVRTWVALEKLVDAHCLPMASYGVRALDVGAGPGPSAFAVHDFYAAMTKFAELTANERWRQPARITCVENNDNTNHLRHLLAEIVYEQSLRKSDNILAMTHSLGDFKKIMPTSDRRRRLQTLRKKEDEYDDKAGSATLYPFYGLDEANDIAQSLHRYRLIIFSNFLTEMGTVTCLERNLIDILHDAQPGTVILVLGAMGNEYPLIYEYVDQLAQPAGFRPKAIPDDTVSSADSVVCDRVYEEGKCFYEFLQYLSPNRDEETKEVRSHFEESRIPARSSQLRVYRKYSYTAK